MFWGCFLLISVRNNMLIIKQGTYYLLFEMDIEFVEEKYRDDIFKLMEVCGIEMAEAYELYTNANNSFENAMQMFFSSGVNENNANQNSGFSSSQFSQQNQYVAEQLDDFDTLYQKYKVYKNSGAKFTTKYEDRNNTNFFSSLVPKFLKSQPQQNFKKLLQQYFDKRPCTIKFTGSSLSHTLATSQKFPVIAYILDFSAPSKPKIEQILRSNQFAEMVNVQYKNVGIDPNYDIEKSLVRFVDRKKFNNSLVILRVNAVEEVETINHIPLIGTSAKEVMDKLKLSKNLCISKDLDDGHLERRFQEQLMGNFDYQKPMSIAERRKIAQDRQIRKKQQQQFFASMKAQQKKQQKKPNPPQSQPQPQSSSSKPTESKPQQKKQSATELKQIKTEPKRNIQEQRKKLREKLKTYTEGMNIRLRFPNGEAVVLVVDGEEKAQYLYWYVEGIEKEIGFQRDADRKFDIIRPYDKLNLSENLNKTLKQIFEGSDSENLAVAEI